MTNSFADWKDRIAWGAVLGIVVGGAGWAGWITTEVTNHVSASEVIDVINHSAPYVRDRELILSKIDTSERTEGRLAVVIEQNTKAINTIDKTLVRLATQVDAVRQDLKAIKEDSRQ